MKKDNCSHNTQDFSQIALIICIRLSIPLHSLHVLNNRPNNNKNVIYIYLQHFTTLLQLIINDKLLSPLKLFFYLSIITNNNLHSLKICCENIMDIAFLNSNKINCSVHTFAPLFC